MEERLSVLRGRPRGLCEGHRGLVQLPEGAEADGEPHAHPGLRGLDLERRARGADGLLVKACLRGGGGEARPGAGGARSELRRPLEHGDGVGGLPVLEEVEGQPDPGPGLVGVEGQRPAEVLDRGRVARVVEGGAHLEGLLGRVSRVEADGLADVRERIAAPADLLEGRRQLAANGRITGREADGLLEERDAQVECVGRHVGVREGAPRLGVRRPAVDGRLEVGEARWVESVADHRWQCAAVTRRSGSDRDSTSALGVGCARL